MRTPRRRRVGIFTRTSGRSHGRGWFGEHARHSRAARIAARTRYHNMLSRMGVEDTEPSGVLMEERGNEWYDSDEQRMKHARRGSNV